MIKLKIDFNHCIAIIILIKLQFVQNSVPKMEQMFECKLGQE